MSLTSDHVLDAGLSLLHLVCLFVSLVGKTRGEMAGMHTMFFGNIAIVCFSGCNLTSASRSSAVHRYGTKVPASSCT